MIFAVTTLFLKKLRDIGAAIEVVVEVLLVNYVIEGSCYDSVSGWLPQPATDLVTMS